MKILHLYKDYFPVLGGIENHIKVLAEAQASAGHDVTVLTCDPSWQTHHEVYNSVAIIKAGRLATVASMPLSTKQPWLLLQQKPDVVHIHSPYPLGEFANWLLGRARATVITHHSDIVRQRALLRFYGPFLRQALQAVDQIIATSPNYIDSSPWLSPHRNKCTIVPLGVDITRFTANTKREGGHLDLLFVGRLRYYKGLDTLLRALPHVPDARLKIVGTGPMLQTWEALTHELALTKRVTFVGEVDDEQLPACYQNADLFVLPANARSEAFGTVLIEAMASGLPCITTDVGTGTSWVVQDGETGYVVPPQEPLALAQAIQSMADDAALRTQFGEAALARAQTEFPQARMIERVMAVYEKALHR